MPPILALDSMGRVVETDGFGQSDLGKGPIYVMDGQLAVGESSRRERAMRSKIAKSHRQAALQKRARLQKRNQMLAMRRRAKLLKIKREHEAKKRRALMMRRERSRRYMAARRQGPMSYRDTTPLTGDPYMGFQSEGIYGPIGTHPQDFAIGYSTLPYGMGLGVYDGDEGLGIFKKIGRGLKKAARGIGRAARGVGRGIGKVGRGIGKVGRFVGKGIGKVAKGAIKIAAKVGKVALKVAGTIMKYNPLVLAQKALKVIPGINLIYKGLDKLTGGTLTSLENLAMMPGRAVRGEKITRAEFIDGLMLAAKIGMIAVTGGSAAALIGAASGALKNGPLGKIKGIGTLLSIGEVAGMAIAGGGAISSALAKKGQDLAIAEAQNQIIKRTPLGKSELAATLFRGATGSAIAGGGVSTVAAATVSTGTSYATQKAVQLAAQKAGVAGVAGAAALQSAIGGGDAMTVAQSAAVGAAQEKLSQHSTVAGLAFEAAKQYNKKGVAALPEVKDLKLSPAQALGYSQQVLQKEADKVANANKLAVQTAQVVSEEQKKLVKQAEQAKAARLEAQMSASKAGTNKQEVALKAGVAEALERDVIAQTAKVAKMQEIAVAAAEKANLATKEATVRYTLAKEGKELSFKEVAAVEVPVKSASGEVRIAEVPIMRQETKVVTQVQTVQTPEGIKQVPVKVAVTTSKVISAKDRTEHIHPMLAYGLLGGASA